MLHYLRSLQAWFGEEEWSKYPVAKTSMALLQDFHHSPAILDYPPNLIAIACINLSLQIYGVVVPLMDECDQQPWFNVIIKIFYNFKFKNQKPFKSIKQIVIFFRSSVKI